MHRCVVDEMQFALGVDHQIAQAQVVVGHTALMYQGHTFCQLTVDTDPTPGIALIRVAAVDGGHSQAVFAVATIEFRHTGHSLQPLQSLDLPVQQNTANRSAQQRMSVVVAFNDQYLVPTDKPSQMGFEG